jgi:hypothetical protein
MGSVEEHTRLIKAVNTQAVQSIATARAVASLIDIVEELAQGAAAGTKPDSEWLEVLVETLAKHRVEMGFKPPGEGTGDEYLGND